MEKDLNDALEALSVVQQRLGSLLGNTEVLTSAQIAEELESINRRLQYLETSISSYERNFLARLAHLERDYLKLRKQIDK